jgi:hypothetical protein
MWWSNAFCLIPAEKLPNLIEEQFLYTNRPWATQEEIEDCLLYSSLPATNRLIKKPRQIWHGS